MTKLVQNDIASLTNEQSALAALNSNYAVLEAFSDTVLSRDGTTPNQMNADLDMNSKKILNIGDPLDMNGNRIIGLDDAVALNEPVTLNQFQAGVASSGAAPVTASFITVNAEPNLVNERSLVAGTGVSLTDGGANSTLTVNLDGDLQAVATLATTGLVTRTAANTMTTRSLTQPAAGITISNSDGVAGNPTVALANDLSAVEGLSTAGIATRTAADTWTTRTVTGTANEITLTAGDGVSGNPTVSIPSSVTFTGKTVTGGTYSGPTVTGTLDIQQNMQWSGDINPSVTADQNDWTPTGLSTATIIRADPTATRNITGLTGGADGRIIGIINVNATNALVLKNESASSSAANRFSIGADITLSAGQGATFCYDSTSSRWRPLTGSGTAGGGGGSNTVTRRTITAADTVISTDNGNIVEATSGTFSLAFTAAATLANGFWTIISNSGTGDVTLDPNGAETIDGLTTYILYPGGSVLVQCNGTSFESYLLTSMRKQFDSTGTWTKPGCGTIALVQAWGAGGGAGRSASANDSGGGGGGGYKEYHFPLSALGTTETATVGTGGAGKTGAAGAGANGTNSTFNSLTAFAGSAGADAGGVGLGGGAIAIGVSSATNPYYDGGFGGFISTGQATSYGGGGGGSGAFAGGTSQFGGAGGAGSAGAPSNGVQPGGGGGASSAANTNGANGAAGRIIVTVL